VANTSASGGYLTPAALTPLPGGLTLQQFIQSLIVGVTGYAGALVRPKWQENPPKQPSIDTNWIAFGIELGKPDTNAFVETPLTGDTYLRRQQDLDVSCVFYGPLAQESAFAFLDGLQITQNLEALRIANMGYRGFDGPVSAADLVHERWVPVWTLTLTLTRQIDRTYPILSFVAALGSMHTVVNGEDVATNWETPPEV
jgi:hypothetical protein